MSQWFDTDKGTPATHNGKLPEGFFGGDPIGGILDPLSMMSGLPSFSADGGHAAPSMARSGGGTSIMGNSFTVGGPDGVSQMVSVVPWLIGGLALWLTLKK